MNVYEWLNTNHYNTAISQKELELSKEAWLTSRQLTFEEIAETLEARAKNKPPEVQDAFSYAAELVRRLSKTSS